MLFNESEKNEKSDSRHSLEDVFFSTTSAIWFVMDVMLSVNTFISEDDDLIKRIIAEINELAILLKKNIADHTLDREKAENEVHHLYDHGILIRYDTIKQSLHNLKEALHFYDVHRYV